MARETDQVALWVGELARRAGVAVRAVRHYADAGLLPEAGRGAGGHRRHGADAVDRPHRIRDLRAVGMPLAAMAGALADDGSLERALAAQPATVGGQLTAVRWREAAPRALTAAADDRRPEPLRLLGGLPQPPTGDALVRCRHRQLPRAPTAALRTAVVDAAVPALPPGARGRRPAGRDRPGGALHGPGRGVRARRRGSGRRTPSRGCGRTGGTSPR
ncbi:MerR family DNA-binding transcriptional regulator [Streptomyces sp. NPDC090442]|uniref:helix-turn-helix domain-containing protein n=1 Tax=Streptomyces sp. NPDC090442 TaxID=3365962 RepID=UPI0037FA7965